MGARMIADTRNTKAARARRKRDRTFNLHDMPPEFLALISGAVRDAATSIEREVLGDLDNWKPTGILSAPIRGTRAFASHPDPTGTLSPHALDAGSRT